MQEWRIFLFVLSFGSLFRHVCFFLELRFSFVSWSRATVALLTGKHKTSMHLNWSYGILTLFCLTVANFFRVRFSFLLLSFQLVFYFVFYVLRYLFLLTFLIDTILCFFYFMVLFWIFCMTFLSFNWLFCRSCLVYFFSKFSFGSFIRVILFMALERPL